MTNIYNKLIQIYKIKKINNNKMKINQMDSTVKNEIKFLNESINFNKQFKILQKTIRYLINLLI